MSISTTLSNALTGLAAASRSAQVVSTNVSNSMTEGFARREVELSARVLGGAGAGVQIDGIRRIVDETALRERRLASASVALYGESAGFQRGLLDAIGEPQEPGSLTARVAEFEAALLEATSRPESDARLNAVINSAEMLAGKLNDATIHIQDARVAADKAIASEVERLNASLQQISDLNDQILRARGTDQDYPGLLDNRQRVIDEISDLVPLRQLQRENDTVALYTLNGGLLVDLTPSEFEFTSSEPITAEMTLAGGALSGLTLNGIAVGTSGANAAIAGGRLAGLFQVRDELAVSAQDTLDSVARDLVSRFEDPTLDTTLAVGDPGLFTDGGGVLDPLDVVGLAGRVAVNTRVDPDNGGEIWRLRDGIGATVPGPAGDAGLVTAMLGRLQESRVPVGGSLSSAARPVSGFAADFVSLAGQEMRQSDTRLAFEQSRYFSLDQALRREGVDTDQELQKLLLIEQAYAANVRVIQTADELIQLLIGL